MKLIIISQDDDKLVEFSDLQIVKMIDEYAIIKFVGYSDEYSTLGKYESENRAKQILKEIARLQAIANRINEEYIYEMPKE